jgi:hypothetical protein
MKWLDVLQLSFALLQQALAAFAQGQRKEAPAQVSLEPEHQETLLGLIQQEDK